MLSWRKPLLAHSQEASAKPRWMAGERRKLELKGEKSKQMVGTGRFELPTPRTPSECSTRLSHVPTMKKPL